MSSLRKKNPGIEKFKRIKVVILPNSQQPDRPTRIDIALLENRYQVHSDGKSEYSVMNKALTYRDNIKSGISLEAMLADDSDFSQLTPDSAKFKRKKNLKKTPQTSCNY